MSTFHVTGVASTETNTRYSGCPYTTNARYLIRLLVQNGHTVFHYCNVRSETEAEDVYVTPENFLVDALGENHKTQYHADPKPPIWGRVCRDFSIACAHEIRKRIQPRDFVILTSDGVQDVIELLQDIESIPIVESNIGYHDPVAEFRIFHTHTWRASWRARSERAFEIHDMFKDSEHSIDYNPNVMVPITDTRRVTDTVILPMFDSQDFQFSEKKDYYYLFLGRIIMSKGILEAIELTAHIGAKLIIAGPGDFETEFGMKPPRHVEFMGMANLETRANLLAHAKCLLAFTQYNEPCGYIVPEASHSGTPVVATATGGFTETVEDGVNGFTGDCFADWVEATEKLETLDPQKIRQYAEDNFSLKSQSPKYEQYFKRIEIYMKNRDSEDSEYFAYRD